MLALALLFSRLITEIGIFLSLLHPLVSHHVVTKRAEVSKSADSASDMTRFVTLVTKRAATPLPASHHVISKQGASRSVVSVQLRERERELAGDVL